MDKMRNTIVKVSITLAFLVSMVGNVRGESGELVEEVIEAKWIIVGGLLIASLIAVITLRDKE